SRVSFAVVDSLHRAQPEPPTPAVETRGIPITAVSTASAFFTARLIAGLAGFRAVSATIDPRWPLDHQIGVIRTTGSASSSAIRPRWPRRCPTPDGPAP